MEEYDLDFSGYSTEDYHEASELFNNADEIFHHPWIAVLCQELADDFIVQVSLNGEGVAEMTKRLKEDLIMSLLLGIQMGKTKMKGAMDDEN